MFISLWCLPSLVIFLFFAHIFFCLFPSASKAQLVATLATKKRHCDQYLALAKRAEESLVEKTSRATARETALLEEVSAAAKRAEAAGGALEALRVTTAAAAATRKSESDALTARAADAEARMETLNAASAQQEAAVAELRHIAESAQASYHAELESHAVDVRALQALRKQIDDVENAKAVTEQEAASWAARFKAAEASWTGQKTSLSSELQVCIGVFFCLPLHFTRIMLTI